MLPAMRHVRPAAFVLAVMAGLAPRGASAESGASGERVSDLRVRLLSTMLATMGIGEWGFSALVEVDGERILFDTGQYPETVLRNADELGIDLSDVTHVVLSHFHGDHTGGLLSLREALSGENPVAISMVLVAEGIFHRRRGDGCLSQRQTGIAAGNAAWQ